MGHKKCKNASVLLIAFNRPDNAKAVLEQIRKAEPSKFYFAVDGPREDNLDDQNKCKECQSLLEMVDWECEINTLFRKENVGCGFGPSQAISWAFETTDRLIVLEDDCLPSQSFFSYCEELLDKYENDKRVGIISGLSIHSNSPFFGDKDYLFSRFSHTWGWATWRNRWAQFDMYMKDFPAFSKDNILNSVFNNNKISEYFEKRFNRIYNSINDEVKHSWDSQWDYARIKNGFIDITPRINLITNIGATDGTHNSEGAEASLLQSNDFNEALKHPSFVVANSQYDNYHFTHYVHPNALKQLYTVLKRKNGIRELIRLNEKKVWK